MTFIIGIFKRGKGIVVLKSFWAVPLHQLWDIFNTTERGLSIVEAHKRQKRYGVNAIVAEKKRKFFLQLFRYFNNPLILLLLIASVISYFVDHKSSSLIILFIVFFNVLLNCIQEYRAQNAVEALKLSVAVKSVVRRNDIEEEVFSTQIVPGDIVHLTTGDLIPADGRLFLANNLYVNQSVLTGESAPVLKNANDIHTNDFTQADNSVFMGASVVSGEGFMIVCQTGARTFLGQMGTILKSRDALTAFEEGIKKFSLFLVNTTIVLCVLVFIINLLFHKPFFETAAFALALSVGMTPELLPMIMTLTLTKGSLVMAQKNVIVKRLSSIHDLGSLDVLCVDKTGTLTENRPKLLKYIDLEGHESQDVARYIYLNSYFESGLKNALDHAILEGEKFSIKGWRKLDEIPFDFEKRRMTVLVSGGHKNYMITKGATDDLLPICLWHAKEKDNIEKVFHAQSNQGLRLLGLAIKEVSFNQKKIENEKDMKFLGFALFHETPKMKVKEILDRLSADHVNVKIITGDNEYVTTHLCKTLHIKIAHLLTGHDISTMNDHTLAHVVEKTNVFCRISPSQKTRILDALREKGHVVGFLGDGINDAPALHRAHVGISVDTAVDVAKDAADIVLLKKDLSVIHSGIIEGRRIYGNIMKYLMMVTSSNFGDMLSMALSSFFLPFLPMTAAQILLGNLLYDVSQVAVSTDYVDKEILSMHQKWSIAFIKKFMIILGGMSSIFDIVIFIVMLKVFHVTESLFHTTWFLESSLTEILVVFVIRTRFSPFKSFPHLALLGSSLGVLALSFFIALGPWGQYFGFVPLPLKFFGMIFAFTLSYLLMAEFAKRVFYCMMYSESSES